MQRPKIFDFMNTQLTYNKTYAYRLPPKLIETARGLADFHENGVFSDKESGGVGNSTFIFFCVPPSVRPSLLHSLLTFNLLASLLLHRIIPSHHSSFI